jgi:glycerol-3-phosphate acyltransferase PlsY
MYFQVSLFILAFLIGGIPTGYILVKVLKKRDIRDFGSGNIGFSNVYRTEGIIPGALVLFIDVTKAFLVTFFFSNFFSSTILFRLLLGITVILGNIFTPLLKFKGGKGVATSFGVALALNPFAAFCALCTFLVTVKLTRYMSVGSLVGVTVYVITSYLFYEYANFNTYSLVFSVLVFFAIFLRHISNIKRLLHGQENRIGSEKTRS